MPEPVTYYEVLVISKTASTAEIKAAWKKLAKVYHPDLLGDVEPSVRQASEAKFKEINEAYKVLSNIESRRVYDQRWDKVEATPRSPMSATAHHHSQAHQRSARRRPAPRKSTPRSKALGMLIAMGLLASWALAYVFISQSSPRGSHIKIPWRSSDSSGFLGIGSKNGCVPSADCQAYKIVVFRAKMQTSDGHTGLFILNARERQFTAYCEDESPSHTQKNGCSKFSDSIGKILWVEDSPNRVCYHFDGESWIEKLFHADRGAMQCLKVVGVRAPSGLPAVSYNIRSYDATDRSENGLSGLFVLESKYEIVRAYCDPGIAPNTNRSTCQRLSKLVGQKVPLVPSQGKGDSLCFDRDSEWRLDQHGEYYQENRECLRVADQTSARHGPGAPPLQRRQTYSTKTHP